MFNRNIDNNIIICNFKRLNPSISAVPYTKQELKKSEIILSYDGKIYLNSKGDFTQLLEEILSMMVKHSQKTLIEAKEMYQNKYPNVKSVEDIVNVDKNSRHEALALILIDVELKRRKIQEEYFGR